jgi:ribonuclease E
MTKRMLIDATHAEETRVVVLDGSRLEDFDVETSTKKQLKGNIYLAKVVRVEPSLQAAFVEYGGGRHGFLAFGEIHPDYYQIPVADRQRLLAMQAEEAQAEEEDEDDDRPVRQASPLRAAEERGEQPEVPAESAADMGEVAHGALTAGEVTFGALAVPAESEEAAEPASELDAPAELLPPPETLGGESDVFEGNGAEEARARRSSRFLRNYRIQEVIHRRQIMLIQVVKEERGTKGAALTTYISLAGRFCVLMPNSPRGGGISRKITSAADRRRLKEITAELEIPQGMGLIVRTAGAARPKPEIRRDCEYLMRLWDDIRELTLRSMAPALVYEEANLIKRAIRDGYSRDIDEVLVDGEQGWKAAHDFMRMLMPSHAKKVISWKGAQQGGPLFAKMGVEAQLDAMLSPTVQLRSGGYLIINQAEALVAIDVNSGRATRERGIEETALKTNMEAADEVARQLRLRDLAGLIVIDFIDMESRKHNGMVERRLKEALKNDRARIQVGQISHFGLLEMSRQRLRPSLAETNFITCPHCGGLGHVRSVESSAIHVLRAIEEEGAKGRAAEIRVHAGLAVVMYLLNHKRDRLSEIEARNAMMVVFQPDEALVGPNLRIERLRAQLPEHERPLPAALPVAPAAPALEAEEEEEEDVVLVEAEAGEGADEQEAARAEEEGRRRRRRRRRGGRREEAAPAAGEGGEGEAGDAEGGEVVAGEVVAGEAEAGEAAVGGAPVMAGEAPVTEVEAVKAEESAEAPAAAEPAEPAAEPSADAAAETELDENGQPKARRRGRRGGRRRRKDEGPEEGAPVDAAPAGPPVAPPVPSLAAASAAPAYSGPTPADPFGGRDFDIFDIMDQVNEETAAPAKPARAAAARVAEAPAQPEAPVAEPASTEPVSAGPGETEPGEAGAAAVTSGAAEPATAEPALAEVVAGPAVRPIIVGQDSAAVPAKRGWWRR